MATPAPALLHLRDQIDRLAPSRARGSDGIMGDAAHQARADASAHPEGHVMGNAIDITLDAVNGPNLLDLKAALLADPRTVYVIFNHQIQSRTIQPGVSRAYTGLDGHEHHLHLSIDPAQRDSTADWDLSGVGVGGSSGSSGGWLGGVLGGPAAAPASGGTVSSNSRTSFSLFPFALVGVSATAMLWALISGLGFFEQAQLEAFGELTDPCMCCGRKVARRSVGGRPSAKLRVRHKCPHNEWCRAGEAKQPTGFNEPFCLDCKDAARVKEGLPSVRRSESAMRAEAERRSG